MQDLTEGNVTKQIFLFSLPMLAGNVFQQLYNTVDMMVIGRFLGDDALAAVGPTMPVFFLLISLAMGLGMGVSVLISQYYGAKDYAKVRASVDTGYILMFGMSVVVSILGFLTLEPILRLLRTPERLIPDALTYMNPILIGLVFMFGYNTLASILRGLGDSRTPLAILIVSSLLNIGLDLLFVAVFGMGIAGASWATVLSQAISFVWALVLLDSRNEHVRLDLRQLRFDRTIFKQAARIGLPTGLQQSLVAGGMMFVQGIINPFGPQAITAFAAAARLDQFAAMPAMNLGMALSAFTGQNVGAGRIDRVKQGLFTSLAMSTAISIAMGIVMVFFGRNLMTLFATGEQAIEMGTRYLGIVGAAYVLFSTMFVTNGAIRGAGAAFIPMLSTIAALWIVRIPVASFLSGQIGIDGVWYSMPAGWLVGCTIAIAYFASGKWKTRSLVRPTPAPAELPE